MTEEGVLVEEPRQRFEDVKCNVRKCMHLGGVYVPDSRFPAEEVYVCRAFPRGIPAEISAGDDPHSEVKEGQVGEFIFEARPEPQTDEGEPE